MLDNGIHKFWYHDIGAFVLTGERSLLSVSGKNYIPSKIPVKSGNIVTIDLSPVINNHWGDYARTFYIGNPNDQFKENLNFIESLHVKFKEIFNPDEIISKVHTRILNIIHENDFESLDFRNNFGHSIEEDINNRKWFDSKNNQKLSTFEFFTFEPHIKKKGSNYGIKHENIYYFDGSTLNEV